MSAKSRIVTQIPLVELWTDESPIEAERVRDLDEAAIRDLLGPLRPAIVVANVGDPLCWISDDEIFSFLKAKAYGRIVGGDKIRIEDFPGDYCFAASLWTVGGNGERIILLEKWH